MANLMYYVWVRHHISPKDFYNMSDGEKQIILAFCETEIESLKGR